VYGKSPHFSFDTPCSKAILSFRGLEKSVLRSILPHFGEYLTSF
jgi:hypothetical protein